MKKLILLLALVATSILTAQATFEIAWDQGVGSAASISIEPGDTVLWTWANSSPHSVTTLAGSQETFDSGIETGQGFQYSYTFTQLGTNPYQCDVHPGSMNGIVTVEQVASVADKFAKNIKFYPNPVKNELTVFSLFKLDSYKIYNVIGSLVGEGRGNGNYTQLNMSKLNSGMYFVSVTSDNLRSTFKITKD